jgi:hypothetical protein
MLPFICTVVQFKKVNIYKYNNKICLALLEGSKTDIIDEMNRAISFESKVKSLPPLNEKLLSQSIKPR